jgi:DNA-binding GntR family transcriptional regulator
MQEYKSKVDILYDTLLKDISNGVYKEGDRIIISQVADEEKISTIPVREAIRRLESEGYVEIRANQGVFVVGFSSEKIRSIFHIKGVLEGYATRVAIDYHTPEDVKNLYGLVEEMRECLKNKAFSQYSELNKAFHLEIYKRIPQTELYDLICDLWKKWAITKTVFSLSNELIMESLEEHAEIVRMIKDKEYDAVEFYVRNHKFKAGEYMSRRLDAAAQDAGQGGAAVE